MGFSGHVSELDRRTKGTKPKHFAATSVSSDVLARLGKYLSDLADLKADSRPSEPAGPKVKVDVAPIANDMVA